MCFTAQWKNFSAILIAQLKEKHEHIQKDLELLKYEEHKWIICVNLKMVNFLLGQQGGYTKFPCFIRLLDQFPKKSWRCH